MKPDNQQGSDIECPTPKPPLYYLGAGMDGFGWGICNLNLARALSEYFEVRHAEPMQSRFDAPVFIPLGPKLGPTRPRFEAPQVFGYCFTEEPLGADAARNARQCSWIFTGSDWNTSLLSRVGIEHCSTLVQGVDFERFTDQPWNDDLKGFRVFSGGKYEFRKGQDIVIAAMEQFMSVRDDVFLVTSWSNPWPETTKSMENSWLVDPSNPTANLPQDRIIQLPWAPNAAMPGAYSQTHVGLFPNRAEGGTNMVLMEYMACGRPVIASAATGHLDLMDGEPGPWWIETGDRDWAGWFSASVSDCIVALEEAYADRAALKLRGKECRRLISPWTWKRAAESVWKRLKSFY